MEVCENDFFSKDPKLKVWEKWTTDQNLNIEFENCRLACAKWHVLELKNFRGCVFSSFYLRETILLDYRALSRLALLDFRWPLLNIAYLKAERFCHLFELADSRINGAQHTDFWDQLDDITVPAGPQSFILGPRIWPGLCTRANETWPYNDFAQSFEAAATNSETLRRQRLNDVYLLFELPSGKTRRKHMPMSTWVSPSF